MLIIAKVFAWWAATLSLSREILQFKHLTTSLTDFFNNQCDFNFLFFDDCKSDVHSVLILNWRATSTEGGGRFVGSLYIILGRLHHLPVLHDESLVSGGIIDRDLFSRHTSTGAAATETVQIEEEAGQDDAQNVGGEGDDGVYIYKEGCFVCFTTFISSE